MSALATDIVVTSSGGVVTIEGNTVAGAMLNVYAGNGSLLSQAIDADGVFGVNAVQSAIGNGVVITSTVGASAATGESAPIIVLERDILTTQASTNGATFASSGQVQVGVGQYVDLYSVSNAPANPSNPALVYDSSLHTLSLYIDGHSPLVLVTLGSATTPASLDPSEIFVRHLT